MNVGAWLKGVAMGVGMMALLDPAHGSRRRAVLGDKARSYAKAKKSALVVMQKDFANRAKGSVAALDRRPESGTTDDLRLTQRVRSAMGRFTSHSHSIDVACQGGVVTLTGLVLADEVKDLVKCVERVKGVASVINELDPHPTSEGISGLQGGTRRSVNDKWTPATCLLAVGAGSTLLLMSLGRRGPGAVLAALGGAALVAKGFHDTEHRFDPSSDSAKAFTSAVHEGTPEPSV